MENFHGFRRLASNWEGFPAIFFLFYYKVFRIAVQSQSFPTNNKKIMQPWNFSTANDLHYTVYVIFVKCILQNIHVGKMYCP